MYTERESELLSILTGICRDNHIEVIVDPKEFSITSPCAVDVEHDEEGNLVGIGVYDGTRMAYYTRVAQDMARQLLSVGIIAHNGKGDSDSLRQWGIPVLDSQLIWDTEILAHIIDSSRKGYGLKKLAKEDLNLVYPSYDGIVGKKSAKNRRTLDKWPIQIVAMYNALDCFATWKLYQLQNKKAKAELAYFNSLEKPVSYVFGAMENRGICIDLPYLEKLKLDLEAQRVPLEKEIKNEFGNINLDAPKQVLNAFQLKGVFPEFKGKPSMDQRGTLNTVFKDNVIVQQYKKWNELNTLLTSFVYSYLDRKVSIIHPFFNQCGTRTGRPSCSNPNLLQIPRRTENGKLVRRMFIPREGMQMGDCDFGQIEPRVMAHLSKDKALCDMFNAGVDFHTFTAERLGITRDRAKVLNLSVGYRATFKSVQNQLGGTREEAQKQIDAWWSLFPQVRRWQETLIYDAKRSGVCTTLHGRHIKVDGLSDGSPWKRESAERQLINNITQGSAAEVMKMAMIGIQQMTCFHPSFGLLVQVYDELLFESPKAEVDIWNVKWGMENAVNLDVPLTVDCHTGASWAECK